MAGVLLLTGGPDHAHDFAALASALVDVLTDAGHDVELAEHPDAAADRLSAGVHDALVINALRWRMLGERYDAWRDDWGYATPEGTRRAIAGFVAAGGGLVGNHTAAICFDDWQEWKAVLGGAWNWERSSHPAPAVVQPTLVKAHPVVAGLAGAGAAGSRFELVDEVYGDLDLADGVDVLATAPRYPGDAPQPVVWVCHHGDGRVAYDAFGHDAASLRDPSHARLLQQATAWVTEAGP